MKINFKTWLEEGSSSEVKLIDINGFSSGHHGYGDVPERPAGDPRTNAKWQIYVNNENIEKLLIGLPVIIYDASWQSYHERACKIIAAIQVPYEIIDQIYEIDGNFYRTVDSFYKRRAKEYKFTFVNMPDTIAHIQNLLKVKNFEIEKDIENAADSAAYHQRLTSIVQAGKPVNRPWDGD